MGKISLPQSTGIQEFDRLVIRALERNRMVEVDGEHRVEIGHNSSHVWVACINRAGQARILVSGESVVDGVDGLTTYEVPIKTASDIPTYIGHH
jgi:hypothetical protein